MSFDADHKTSISNEVLFAELRHIRQEMKDLHWQLLLKFSEQMDEMHSQIRSLNQKLAARSISLDDSNNSEDNTFEDNNTTWTEHCVDDESIDNFTSDKRKVQATKEAPVVLEVTTSQPEDGYDIVDVDNDIKSIGLGNSDKPDIGSMGQMSKYLYDESTHIANCRDRHCLLCQSLCVNTTKPDNIDHSNQWKCSVCLRYFKRKYNLKNHMRCHTGEKPYKCLVCDHSFRSKQALKYHSHKHDGTIDRIKLERRRRTLRSKALSITQSKEHVDTHDSVEFRSLRRMEVEESKKEALSKLNSTDDSEPENNIDHEDVENIKEMSVKARSRLKSGSWKCPVCGKFFQRKANLKAHMRVHTGDRPFKCDQCSDSFAVPYSLKVHKRMHANSCD